MAVPPVELSGSSYPRPPGDSPDTGPLASPRRETGLEQAQEFAETTIAPTPVQAGTPLPPRRLLRGAEQLTHLIGARLLVGVTFRNPDGTVVSTEQFCGRVLEVADGVVVVERGPDGEQAVLPADAAAYEPARPGRYVLSNSGEAVTDPDYLTVWDVEIGT